MPRPPVSEEELERVLRAVATGQKQREIAAELHVSIAKLQRCVVLARRRVAEADADTAWLHASRCTGVQVAQRWLKLFRQAPAL
ncbi:MAG TPA: hypothetical protein VIK91_01000 [Nannocystis sp.]